MSIPITLTGLSQNDPVPGTYLEINFAQGPVAGDGAQKVAVLVGNKLSTGSATADTVLYGPDTPARLQTEGDAINLFGAGSELHRMFRIFATINQTTPLYAIVVTESVGAQATGLFTLAGVATRNCTLRILLAAAVVEVPIAIGDTATAVAAAAVAAVNSRAELPATAASALGVVTLSAKQKGPRGNGLRYLVQVISEASPGVTVTGATVDTGFSGGTTSDSSTAALATLLTKRHYYIVSAANDSVQVAALTSQIQSQAAPLTGLRQRGFACWNGSLASGISLAQGANDERFEFPWLRDTVMPPEEVAAHMAAVYSLYEASTNPRTNFINMGSDAITARTWRIPAPRLSSSLPTRADLKAALNSGLSPIGVYSNGKTYLVNRITSRSLTGITPDYRIRGAHKVTVADFFGDDLVAKTSLNMAGFRIADDSLPGAPPAPPGVATPSLWKGLIFGLLDRYSELGLLQNVDAIKKAVIVQRELAPSTRMTARIPLQPIDNLEQTAVAVDQVA